MYGHEDVVEKFYNIKPGADSTSPVECMVGVPDWVDVYGDERSFRITLRVKARREGVDLGLVKKVLGRVEDDTMGEVEEGEDEGQDIEDDVTLTHVRELAMEVQEMEFIQYVDNYTLRQQH